MMMQAFTRTCSSSLLIRSIATQKPNQSSTKAVASKKEVQSVKLLTRVEQLRLLTKAEKAGLLSAAEGAGLSLSTIERLGLLSKAEEFGVLSAATNPGTPSAVFNVSLLLWILGPVTVYLVPEDYPWQVVLQVLVVLACVLGGSAALGTATFVCQLQKSRK